MPKSKLGAKIAGEAMESITNVKETHPERSEKEMWDADEWQAQTAMDVPDLVKQKFPNCRFRWLDPRVISQRGYRRWKVVHIDGSPEELNMGFGDTLGRAVDTLVRRGDLILAYMPERLARAREAYYKKLNSPPAMQRKSKEELAEELANKREGVSVIGAVFGGEAIKTRRKVYDMGRAKQD